MASALMVLSHRGKQLITRNYRQDVPSQLAKAFVEKVCDVEESEHKPVFEVDGLTFAWIQRDGLYLVLVAKINTNAAMLMTYLDALYATLVDYLGVVSEEVIRENFVIIYELFDEMMDFGYPQCTDARLLQQYITQERSLRDLVTDSAPPPELPSSLKGGSASCPWRPEGLKYKQNEVFLDVVDSLNLLISAKGDIISSEVTGTVKMKTKLSGMPELILRVNEKTPDKGSPPRAGRKAKAKGGTVDFEDVKFHQCVKLNKFNTDRTISFVPPDGDFDLMTYRLNMKGKVKPLLKITASVQNFSDSRMEYSIKAVSQFDRASSATNVKVVIPVPPDIHSPNFKATVGQVRYHPDADCIVWSIELFPGGKEFLCRAEFGRPSIRSEIDFSRVPIKVNFEIPYFTVSNFQVRTLKVISNPAYKSLTWVRYFTRSGKYEIRMGT